MVFSHNLILIWASFYEENTELCFQYVRQVADFVNRFMPAYETYLPALYSKGPQRLSSQVPVLKVSLIIDC